MELLITNPLVRQKRKVGRILTAFMLSVFLSVSLLSIPAAVYAQTQPVPEHPLQACGVTKLSMCIAGIFYVFFVDLTSPIAYLGGAMFDTTAAISLQGPTYASGMIAKAWVIARDMANMTFVFLLLTIAIELILDLEGAGVGKKLAKILVVALLINFSFFFSRVAIDISNVAAHVFYDNIALSGKAGGGDNTGAVIGALKNVVPTSISEQLLNGINPQQLLATKGFKAYYDSGNFFTNLGMLLVLFFIFGVINIILAFVFVTAAFQFMTRIIGLWMAIILSPLAFVCAVLPIGKSMWKKWVTLLLSNAFYAPAFLFVVYIMVSMLKGNTLAVDMGNFLAAQAKNANSSSSIRAFLDTIVGMLLRLGIVVGMFYAATKVGSKMGTWGAEGARSWAESFTAKPAKKFASYMGAGALAGAGYTVTGTAGRYAATLDNKLKKTPWGNTRTGTFVRALTTKPVAKMTVGGAASGATIVTNKETRERAYTDAVRDKDNHELVTNYITNQAGMSYAERDAAETKIKNMGKREILSFKTKELEGVSHVMSDKQKEWVAENDKYTDNEREGFAMKWNTRGSAAAAAGKPGGGSKDAPVNKIDSLVTDIESLETTLGTANRIALQGNKINSAALKAAKEKVEEHKIGSNSRLQSAQAELNDAVRRRNAGDPAAAALQRTATSNIANELVKIDKADKLLKKYDEVGEHLKKVPVGVGNASHGVPSPSTGNVEVANAGEVVVK